MGTTCNTHLSDTIIKTKQIISNLLKRQICKIGIRTRMMLKESWIDKLGIDIEILIRTWVNGLMTSNIVIRTQTVSS